MKIGFVTFGLPPEYNRRIEGKPAVKQIDGLLGQMGCELIRVDIHTAEELQQGILRLRSASVCCIVIILKHWTRIALVVKLVRSIGLPAALYARTTGGFNGTTALTAASAVLRETVHSRAVDTHARFREGMEEELLVWVQAASAYTQLRESRLLCWGGDYGANMPYTRSDPDFLESRLIGEVMTEQEIVLTDKAEAIMEGHPEKVTGFVNWLLSNGVQIHYDESMLTIKTLQRQVALYLAARERLSELKNENIQGVSIKCHFELSTTNWGCTACMLPAFLPFPEGPAGPVQVMPVACEGDLNGLVSMVMLHALNRDIPPLFGDFVEYNEGYTLLRNCGASSVYWAGCSPAPAVSFPQTELLPNLHGKTGAAVHYETPRIEVVTICRLFRLHGEFHVFTGKGRIIEKQENTTYSDPWPHTRVQLETEAELLFQVYPCNHASLTQGDFTRQIEWICRFTGIPCHRIDSKEEMRYFLRGLYKP
jgi:L-fucose isomerase-like protein